ncbi:tRNA (adenosine(37)-N6)-threonylcarbamoyltransferase complex dimerization subunit type 1 TsaB [Pelotomaculum terephthalicicum JT]|nr:tRNA (adenosine(37)-N6)-threonylcarbamoyltransferase complex dimerization subunit type 1 TsaB [Pelotomaculum sp. PtaB.Bin117]MCG9966699.1 tRNA (adenosine(37)-N6)-threonylcarbamoyltransferase complex dimerization subunit type 1 TsaB [Pelotomaculum terephthalicicum JT]OPX91442.1 MAG: tRNA threonylcarbamoyladenosine biosynthesis protein TsaB [Pelotomaculum sp. PtaB.Bin117]OPY62978.1 MAG: tRNA threonylcarbamoyladenosine biosynthesis protein TsaB [Pelotomaculum sp. PtaU1.Bin065]
MYVLGIESATPVAAVAVAGREGILAERMVLNKRTHSVNLLPMIKAVLEDAEVERRNLAGIAVSSGPGSFTGLRIGMSTAKTLAQVWKLPVTGISTLDTLAYALDAHKRLVCPILNARKNEVYTAVYDHTGQAPVLLVSPRAVRIEELIELLAGYQKPVTFLGDGVPVYELRLIAGLGPLAAFAPLAAGYPRGAVVAELGLAAFDNGRGVSPLRLQPEYIRLSEAEVIWRKKHCSGG